MKHAVLMGIWTLDLQTCLPVISHKATTVFFFYCINLCKSCYLKSTKYETEAYMSLDTHRKATIYCCTHFTHHLQLFTHISKSVVFMLMFIIHFVLDICWLWIQQCVYFQCIHDRVYSETILIIQCAVLVHTLYLHWSHTGYIVMSNIIKCNILSN